MPKKPLSTSTVFLALAGRVTTAESDIDALQSGAAGLDSRVDALEAGGGGGGGTGGVAGSVVAITADTNNLAVGTEEVIPLSNTTSSFKTVTGIAGGSAGRVLRLIGAGTCGIVFAGESSSSTAANRLAQGISLSAGGVVTLVYNGSTSRWEVFG